MIDERVPIVLIEVNLVVAVAFTVVHRILVVPLDQGLQNTHVGHGRIFRNHHDQAGVVRQDQIRFIADVARIPHIGVELGPGHIAAAADPGFPYDGVPVIDPHLAVVIVGQIAGAARNTVVIDIVAAGTVVADVAKHQHVAV